MPKRDKQEIVSRAILARYYQRYYGELRSYASKMVGDRDLAEDMVQQVIANTIAAVRDGRRIEVEDLSAWLHRCIRNLSIDHHRTYSVEPLDPLLEMVDDPPYLETAKSSAEMAEIGESWRLIAQAVEILPPHFRDAFLLAELRGLTYSEIATVLDRSVHSVRQILSRARHHVRDIVGWESVVPPSR